MGSDLVGESTQSSIQIRLSRARRCRKVSWWSWHRLVSFWILVLIDALGHCRKVGLEVVDMTLYFVVVPS